MRIAFVSHSHRKVGGTEVYLDSILPALSRAGHSVAWLYEKDLALSHDPIFTSEPGSAWSASELGLTKSLRMLEQWKPDVIYAHGVSDPELEVAVIAVAPSVLYLHNYYGTCISGDKLHSTANPTVCERRFGAACLPRYFPQHCGGRNPLTMWSQFRLQSRRLELMRHYRVLIANSKHMVRELARHDLEAQCVYPFTAGDVETQVSQPAFESGVLRLVFAGRMSSLKGGNYLLDAAPVAQRLICRKLHLTLAGDGPDRPDWERKATQLTSDTLTFEFTGWLSSADLRSVIARSHLHVLPSIWPEPFGLSGLEAGLLGVPSVAFAVGGIPEWLSEGVNGHLAPLPVTVEGLAAAIAKVFMDAEHYARVRAGACREARGYQMADHIARLIAIFERCRA
ncbi:MAG TPA: glycosyltransferase family 4 protein [Terriglobales bacterium]|nr:glycosyltransferase family 4 protein [Terriglobales bacterium]